MQMPTLHPLRGLMLGGTVALVTACASSGPEPYMLPASVQPSPEYRAPAAAERYAPFQENQLTRVATEPVSTFSVDVDTASYSNVRRFINAGRLPPREAVRIEEMVNYFDYSYVAPRSKETPFGVTTEVGPTPWNKGSHLLHIGIKGLVPERAEPPARNLVFLIDVSGSMETSNKLGLLKKSLGLLVNQLTSADRVAIVVYAGSSGLVLPSTRGNRRDEIIDAIDRLQAGGSTNGGAGIQLAYSVAQEHFIKDGVNRVILATDGDFNVGLSSNSELTSLIKEKKRSGVGLTVLGFGMGNYNDYMLEAISNSGDGNAAYIDTLDEARKVLVTQMNATLNTIARDTKIQIEFNPRQVSSYRLVGYENRMLNQEDFKNDRVDAGDVGEGHTVTAIYEITLADELRYQPVSADPKAHDNELAWLKIRYKQPDEETSRELVHTIKRADIRRHLRDTSNDFRFSASVAAFGQLLRGSRYVEGYGYEDVLSLARNSRGEDAHGFRREFVGLVKTARHLERTD